jgi:hapalindole biogenesis HpiC1 cyclase-like protein
MDLGNSGMGVTQQMNLVKESAMKASAFAIGLLALGAAQPAFAGAKDGSFEIPQLGECCQQEFKAGIKLDKWTVVGNTVTLTSTHFTQNGFTFTAQDGAQWLNLAGTNGMGGVQEKMKIAQGTYTLAFSIGSVYDTKGKNGTSSAVSVFIDGSPEGTFTIQANSNNKTTQQWQRFTIEVLSGNPNITVKFVGADAKGDMDCGLDNVTLTKKF